MRQLRPREANRFVPDGTPGAVVRPRPAPAVWLPSLSLSGSCVNDSARPPQAQFNHHGIRSGPQGTGQEGCAGSDSIEEKQRASTEMRTTTSWALKARRRHPGFTGAPALGPPYPSFQVGVPPQLWVPTRLMKVTPIYGFKILSKLGIEGNFLNPVKDIYQNNMLLLYLVVNDAVPFL